MHIAFSLTGEIMKVLSQLIIPLFVLTSLPCQANAQEETWTIVTVAGDTLVACTLDSLIGTSCAARRDEGWLLISVDSIRAIFRESESAFVRGATIGGCIGAIVGLAIGVIHFSDVESPYGWFSTVQVGAGIVSRAALAGAGGFLIGGAFGAARGTANSYELEMRTLEEKLQILRPLTIAGKNQVGNH